MDGFGFSILRDKNGCSVHKPRHDVMCLGVCMIVNTVISNYWLTMKEIHPCGGAFPQPFAQLRFTTMVYVLIGSFIANNTIIRYLWDSFHLCESSIIHNDLVNHFVCQKLHVFGLSFFFDFV